MEMCRACLCTESEMMPLNEECLQSYKLLTNLPIELNDNLPQFMCRECWDCIEAFVEFRNKCITVEASFHEIWNNVTAEIDGKQDVKLTDVDVNTDVGVKMEIEHNDYIDFNDDCNLEIKVEADQIGTKCRKLKKEKKTSKSSKAETTVTRKRGRPRKDAVVTRKRGKPKKDAEKTVPYIEIEPIDTLLPCGLCVKSYEDKESLFNHLEKHRKGTTCAICKEEFQPWSRLLAHRITHLDVNKRRCHICWKPYRVDFYLEYHYLTTHCEKEFPGLACKYCSRVCSTPMKMKGHLWSQHSQKKFTCDYCKKTYPNKNNLRIHIFQHSSQMNYFCDKCSFSCRYSNALKRHQHAKHLSEAQVKYICKECKAIYYEKAKYDKHKCRSKVVCTVCGKLAQNKYEDHKLRIHADVSYKCKLCYRWFEDELKLEKHSCIKMNLICPECGKNMKHAGQLARHMRSHSDERAYKCHRCPATFKSNGNLRLHQLKHDNIRPHKCDFCSMRFFTNAVRIKHMRVHTGEKPYVCNLCSKGFTGNHNLKVHMKVHGLDLVVKKGAEPPPPPVFGFQ